MIILQIEGIEGIQNLDEILSVPGIDIIFIGPYDLSQSLGLPGNVHHPKVIEQMKLIVKKPKMLMLLSALLLTHQKMRSTGNPWA